jgi:hypothetical protein
MNDHVNPIFQKLLNDFSNKQQEYEFSRAIIKHNIDVIEREMLLCEFQYGLLELFESFKWSILGFYDAEISHQINKNRILTGEVSC